LIDVLIILYYFFDNACQKFYSVFEIVHAATKNMVGLVEKAVLS